MVVPNNLRYEITKACHESTGHLGEAGTLAAVSEKYVWSGMQGYISDYCKHCTCIRNKASRKMKEPLQPCELEDLKPRCIIAFDVGVLPWATDRYRYFMVIVDLFSKYIEVAPMKNQEADTICKAITNYWIYRHGKPRIAVSDQAKNIDGTMVHQLCDKLGIEKRRSSPYHPEGNGQAKRSVQTVKMRARCVINEGSIPKYDWPSVMQENVFCINTAINDSTKYSPYQIMYGDVPTRDSNIWGPQVSRDTGSIELEEIMEESRAEVVRIWQDVAQNLNRA